MDLDRLLHSNRTRPSTRYRGSLANVSRESSQFQFPDELRSVPFLFCVVSVFLWLVFGRLRRSCTCPGEDHPGPSTSVGRGAPEIDILEVEYGSGQMVSQSAQFAPFTHDYLYQNDTQDEWHIYSPNITTPNSYQYVIVLLSVLVLRLGWWCYARRCDASDVTAP